ncbi:aspartate-alanine antiporter [Solitalea sp. MAHUQ-68]|uniref:Aspartate-alanine antiporter n=1 Tax=Solitalea agri TaxID=2953739 RepID=A0A9X2F4K1_9SPHI|nr:aspartate-alanine antiporter [Solitalea agri]MCO4294674.1 aspartate-alanine antiporter [Solitalea agri]
MNWIISTLQQYPELSVFLALALGFFIGNIKIGSFSLGSVTGVLLMGVLIGQFKIDISPTVKSVFFLMFLFAVGYSVGPQFFRGLKKDGLPQVYFAIIICVLCLLVPYLIARLLHYDVGTAAGFLAGANTISAVIGVASDSIQQLNLSAAEKTALINKIPIAYAVTYIFGTAGTAWFLATIGPKLLGGAEKVIQECKELEAQLGQSVSDNDPSLRSALNRVIFRAFKVEDDWFKTPRTIKETEEYLESFGNRLFIQRVKKGEKIFEDAEDVKIQQGDLIVAGGQRGFFLTDQDHVGREINDPQLLSFTVESLSVLIINKEVIGKSLKELFNDDNLEKKLHGIGLNRISRAGVEIPLAPGIVLERGDQVDITGLKSEVDKAAAFLGYADRPTTSTDILFVGVGVLIGGLLGAMTIHIGNVPFSLSTSGGALISGLFFGWLRSQHPTFGRIPPPALWIMNNLGLNTFIAVVGISAGPGFVAGFKELGLSLFIAGVFASIIPMFISLLIGRYLFKFHPAINLGGCAGARTTTAALGAIQDSVKSNTPSLSYTVTYAVGNTLLIIWGVVIVLLFS